MACPKEGITGQWLGQYLHCCVEELSHAGVAATGLLVPSHPLQSLLDDLIIYEDVLLGLDEALGHKSRQPEAEEER